MRADSPAGRRYCAGLLEKLVDIPSIFPDEEEIMVFLESELATLGLRPERIEIAPGRFNLLASLGSGSPRLCLNAHADTMPVCGESKPSARIDGDLLFGLGSCDDKASIAAMVTACLQIASEGEKPGGTVDLLISVDEEADGRGVRTAIEQGYRCDYAIVGEPTSLNVAHIHCGLLFLRLATTGVPAHGCVPWNGANAIERMVELVAEIRGAVGKLAPHGKVGDASLNLGSIRGGDRPNRVPDACEAWIDMRLPPPARVADLIEAAQAIVDPKEWASLTVEKRGEPLHTAAGSRLVTAALASAATLRLRSELIGLRGWTEAEPFQTDLGIASIVLGPGGLAQAHTADEFVSIAETQQAAALYVELAARLLS